MYYGCSSGCTSRYSIGHSGLLYEPALGPWWLVRCSVSDHVADDVRHGLQGNDINGVVMFMPCYVLSCFMPMRIYASYVLCIYYCCTSMCGPC